MFVAGLAQKFLEKRLEVKEAGRGSILEVKEEKGLGKTLDVILYDGAVAQGDAVVFASAEGVVSSKVKALLKPAPLQEMRAAKKFDSVSETVAACGVKIACEGAENALPGSTIIVAKTPEEEAKAREEVASEVKEILVERDVNGIIIKADALGSIEAIAKLFEAGGIPVRRAGVGRLARKDVMDAVGLKEKNPFLGAVFAFNVPVEDDARALAEQNGVKIFDEKIIYNLVDGYHRWVDEEKAREKKEAFAKLTLPAKVSVVPGCCFRANNPAIFGVEVLAGTIRKGYAMMNAEGVEVGTIKQIQSDKKAVDEAKPGQQVAVSMDEPTYGRQVFEKQELYTSIDKNGAKAIEEKYLQALSPDEKELLKEIKKIRGYSLF
jgi:translation initiation factor 5B